MAELRFDEASHTYTLDGKRVPGVTEVLEPLQRLDDIPLDVLEAAAEFGQHLHLACHLHNIDDLVVDSLNPRLAAYFRGYLKFLEETRFRVVLSEARVASPKHGYAGTLDLFGELRKASAMIDIKSTSALPFTVRPQVAAYTQALTETTGQTAKRRYVLHLKPDGYRLVELKSPADFNYFLSCLNVHRLRREGVIA